MNNLLVSQGIQLFLCSIEHCMAAATTIQTNGNYINGDNRIENTSILASLAYSYSTVLCLALTPNKLLFLQIRSQYLPVKYNT